MKIPSVRGAQLNQFEMDIVNAGGYVDESSKKVKPIKITAWWKRKSNKEKETDEQSSIYV